MDTCVHMLNTYRLAQVSVHLFLKSVNRRCSKVSVTGTRSKGKLSLAPTGLHKDLGGKMDITCRIETLRL